MLHRVYSSGQNERDNNEIADVAKDGVQAAFFKGDLLERPPCALRFFYVDF
jgi:hypothetical protein